MLYSIGTSNRTAADFFEALSQRGVSRIVDVRSRPSSRFPHFNWTSLSELSHRAGITYQWEGVALGGLVAFDPDAANVGKALERLIDSHVERVAYFCAEAEPAACHRASHVGAALLVRHGIVTRNILRNDREEDITRTLLRVDPKLIPEAIRDEAVRISLKAEAAK